MFSVFAVCNCCWLIFCFFSRLTLMFERKHNRKLYNNRLFRLWNKWNRPTVWQHSLAHFLDFNNNHLEIWMLLIDEEMCVLFIEPNTCPHTWILLSFGWIYICHAHEKKITFNFSFPPSFWIVSLPVLVLVPVNVFSLFFHF